MPSMIGTVDQIIGACGEVATLALSRSDGRKKIKVSRLHILMLRSDPTDGEERKARILKLLIGTIANYCAAQAECEMERGS